MRSETAKFNVAARRSTRERRPHYFYLEHHIQKRKERKTYVDKSYYDIDIKEIDAKNNRMKIHFKGYHCWFLLLYVVEETRGLTKKFVGCRQL